MAAPVIYAISPRIVPVAGTGSRCVQVVGNLMDPITATMTFGGAPPANLEHISAFLCQGGAPAHAAGAVDVVVSTPGGSATLVGGLTYV
jgi:hypothetical protein